MLERLVSSIVPCSSKIPACHMTWCTPPIGYQHSSTWLVNRTKWPRERLTGSICGKRFRIKRNRQEPKSWSTLILCCIKMLLSGSVTGNLSIRVRLCSIHLFLTFYTEKKRQIQISNNEPKDYKLCSIHLFLTFYTEKKRQIQISNNEPKDYKLCSIHLFLTFYTEKANSNFKQRTKRLQTMFNTSFSNFLYWKGKFKFPNNELKDYKPCSIHLFLTFYTEKANSNFKQRTKRLQTMFNTSFSNFLYWKKQIKFPNNELKDYKS